MQGGTLPEVITSQIASPEHNQRPQGLVCLSPGKVPDGLADTALAEESLQREGCCTSHKC